MNDIFKDMQAKVGCEYISEDVYKRQGHTDYVLVADDIVAVEEK